MNVATDRSPGDDCHKAEEGAGFEGEDEETLVEEEGVQAGVGVVENRHEGGFKPGDRNEHQQRRGDKREEDEPDAFEDERRADVERRSSDEAHDADFFALRIHGDANGVKGGEEAEEGEDGDKCGADETDIAAHVADSRDRRLMIIIRLRLDKVRVLRILNRLQKHRIIIGILRFYDELCAKRV